MHFNNLLLLSVSLATAQGYVAPRNDGSSGSFLSLFRRGGSYGGSYGGFSGSSSCQKDDCYNDIFNRRDNGFCRQYNSPSSCDLPSDLGKYSGKKEKVRSACNCYLQQSTQGPTSTHARPTHTDSPSCVKDDCYNDIFNRKDNGFCRQYNSPSSCNLPFDLNKYSGKKDKVRSACDCYLQHQTTPAHGPTSAGHTFTVTGPEYDYTVTVSRSQPAHTVTVSGPSQPARTVTVSGASQPPRIVTVSGPSQPAHTITVSATATETCPSASKVTETCTVTKTLSFTAQATCSSKSASVITKTCTVTKTVSSGSCSTHTS